jgi:RHS repeat-associated protein
MQTMGAMTTQVMTVTNTVYSVWDGDWAILEEYDNTGALIQGYVQGYHGLVKTLVDNVYYYQDELGSTSHIADGAGALIESYQYDVYGKPRVYNASGIYQIGATPIAKDLFTGQRWVADIGLYDDRNRFMSPDMGRFLQPDPIGFKGDASNLYRYCGNDWANRADPMGTDDHAVGFHGPDLTTKEIESAEQINHWSSPGQILGGVGHHFTMQVRDSIADALGAEVGKAVRQAIKEGNTFAKNGDGDPRRGRVDPRLQRIQAGISSLESNAEAIGKKSPEYGSTAGSAAEALQNVSIKPGKQSLFSSQKIPFRISNDYKTLFYNPMSPVTYFTVPRIAHEGQHLVDHGQGTLFERERRAYDLQYATSLVTGPYERRLNDNQVNELIGQN